MAVRDVLVDEIGHITNHITSRLYPAGIITRAVLFFNYTHNRIRITAAILSLGNEDAHVGADTAGTSCLVINFGAIGDVFGARKESVRSRQGHEALDFLCSGNLVVPQRMKKPAVVMY